jgi:hypothetical protein
MQECHITFLRFKKGWCSMVLSWQVKKSFSQTVFRLIHSSSSQPRISSSFWSRPRASQGSMSRWWANRIAALACFASFRDTSFLPGNAGLQDVAALAIDSFSSIMFSSILLCSLFCQAINLCSFEGRGVGSGKWMNAFDSISSPPNKGVGQAAGLERDRKLEPARPHC